MNPGRNLISMESFSICHWNLNSITAHNYTKILLKAYITVYRFDIIYQTYLDSKILPDNDNVDISGYNLMRSDHTFNSKRGGVCTFLQRDFTSKSYEC